MFFTIFKSHDEIYKKLKKRQILLHLNLFVWLEPCHHPLNQMLSLLVAPAVADQDRSKQSVGRIVKISNFSFKYLKVKHTTVVVLKLH